MNGEKDKVDFRKPGTNANKLEYCEILIHHPVPYFKNIYFQIPKCILEPSNKTKQNKKEETKTNSPRSIH